MENQGSTTQVTSAAVSGIYCFCTTYRWRRTDLQVLLDGFRRHIQSFDVNQDPFDLIYSWRNQSLHGSANFQTIGGDNSQSLSVDIVIRNTTGNFMNTGGKIVARCKWEAQSHRRAPGRSISALLGARHSPNRRQRARTGRGREAFTNLFRRHSSLAALQRLRYVIEKWRRRNSPKPRRAVDEAMLAMLEWVKRAAQGVARALASCQNLRPAAELLEKRGHYRDPPADESVPIEADEDLTARARPTLVISSERQAALRRLRHCSTG